MRRHLEVNGKSGLAASHEQEKMFAEILGIYYVRHQKEDLPMLDIGITRQGPFEMSDFLVLQTLWENQLG